MGLLDIFRKKKTEEGLRLSDAGPQEDEPAPPPKKALPKRYPKDYTPGPPHAGEGPRGLADSPRSGGKLAARERNIHAIHSNLIEMEKRRRGAADKKLELEKRLMEQKVKARERDLERKEKELKQRESLIKALEKDRGISQTVRDFRSQSGLAGILEENVFDSFIVGEDNRFAFFAAQAVAQAPGEAYNPLFIYGDVGLGKSHLVHAIGNYVFETDPQKVIVYTTSESFINELMEAVERNELGKFRDKYRRVDLLMIDDIQFLSGKESTQEEFFHTFNELYNNHKQVVLTSDRPPAEIRNLQKRLVSRFEGGLITEVKKPDKATRVAILREKADARELDIADDVIQYLADNIKDNVRELQGALNRVQAFKKLTGKDLTVEEVDGILRELIERRRPRDVLPKGEAEPAPEPAAPQAGKTEMLKKLEAEKAKDTTLLRELEDETKQMEDDLMRELRKQGVNI